MRNLLRFVALAVALVTVALWFFGGPNRGWTKTSVPVPDVDPFLGSYDRWEKRFVPGVDFLAAGLLGAAALGGASFLFRKK